MLSIVVASTGVAAPIGLTLLLFHFGFHLSLMDSFAAGAALAATSLGTTFAVLESSVQTPKVTDTSTSKDIRHTRIGCTLLAAALIDDILGLVLAAVIPSIRNTDGAHKPLAEAIARPIGVSIAFFLLVEIGPLRRGLVAYLSKVHRRARSSLQLDGASICTLLTVMTLSALVAAAHYAGASVLLGAWVAGALLGEVDRVEQRLQGGEETLPTNPHTPEIVVESQVQQTTLLSTFLTAFDCHLAPIQNRILAPLFFGAVGTAIPFLDLWSGRIIWRGILYSALMMIAKMVAGVWILVWPLTNRKGTQDPASRSSPIYPALLLSIAMVSRGEISLLIAQLGQLGDEAYQLTMWAILLCTILGPLCTGLLIKWKRQECVAGVWG